MPVLCSNRRRSGWKLRLLTRQGPQQGPSGQEIRRAWNYGARTAIVICDPTSPNILQFQAGDAVGALLRRGFFIELQSRFGNIFFVREEVPFGHPALSLPCAYLVKFCRYSPYSKSLDRTQLHCRPQYKYPVYWSCGLCRAVQTCCEFLNPKP